MSPYSRRGYLDGLQKSPRKRERYDSDWEREYMLQLETDPLVKRWTRHHKIKIPYFKENGDPAEYIPDFLVELVDGKKEIHEIKGFKKDDPDTHRKKESAAAYAQKHGVVYRIITKGEPIHW